MLAPCKCAGRDVIVYVGVDTVELELPDRSRVVHPHQRTMSFRP